MTSPDQVSENLRDKRQRLEKSAMPIWQLRAMENGCLRSCINCVSFNKPTEGCLNAGGQRPPAMVIALGCDSWEMDIPF